MGIVYQETGAKIRNIPLPESSGSKVLKHLNQDEKVFILKHNKKAQWYAVTTDDGLFGYIVDWLIWKNLPEPEVKVRKIPPGSTAIGIAKKYYGSDFTSWGNDLRFVVNALAYANNREDHNGVGKPGIFKPGGNDQSWAYAQATENVYIWLPSVSFLNSLRDKVSSGSISYEIWEGVKAVAKAAAFGAAFIGGVLHGAFEGLVDLVKGIADMIWGALKSIFTGNVWNDLKAMWNAVTSMTWEDWKELFFGWMTPWLKKAESSNPFKSGHAYGYITGRILFEIVSLFVGGTAALKIISKLGKLGSKIAKVVNKVTSAISKTTGKAKEGIEKLRSFVTSKKTTKKLPTTKRLPSPLRSIVDNVVSKARSGKLIPFVSETSLQAHFTKHASEFMALYKKTSYGIKDYLLGAKNVIQDGIPVTFKNGPHKGSVNFIRYAGQSGRKPLSSNIQGIYKSGSAKLELVGISSEGKIVTYTQKMASQLDKWGIELIQ